MSLFLRCLFVKCLFICAWILAAQSLHALCACLWATCMLRRVYCTPPWNSSPLAVLLNLVFFTVQRSSSHLGVSCLSQDWKGKKWFRAFGQSVATHTSFHAFITYFFAYSMPCDDCDLVWLIYFYLRANKCMREGQRLDTFLDHTSPFCFESGSLTEPGAHWFGFWSSCLCLPSAGIYNCASVFQWSGFWEVKLKSSCFCRVHYCLTDLPCPSLTFKASVSHVRGHLQNNWWIKGKTLTNGVCISNFVLYFQTWINCQRS